MRTAISIILNGMHHLPQQSKIIPLLFDKWIIVEGASKSNLCTSWCNDMPEEFHNNGSSVDGTVAFLKRLEEEQDNVEVYFASGLWGGKVSMFNYGTLTQKMGTYGRLILMNIGSIIKSITLRNF